MKKLSVILAAFVVAGCAAPARQAPKANNFMCTVGPKGTVCFPMDERLQGLNEYRGGIVIGAIVTRGQMELITQHGHKLNISLGTSYGFNIGKEEQK